MPLNKGLREFLELFNSNRVEYLVVGAFAANAGRVLRALSEFGFGNLGIRSEDLQSPGRVVQLGVQPNRVDLLTGISGVDFDDAWATREEARLEGVMTRFIGRTALLRNKESTGRTKDLGDAEELRKCSGPSHST